MKNLFMKTGDFLRRLIDWFYPPFRRFCPLQMFRYAVCGGANLVLDWVLYFVVFNFVFHQQMLPLGFVTLSSYIASMAVKFPVTLCTGFLLQKYVTFSYAVASRGRVQLLKYFSVVLVNLALNYAGLKFFVEILHLFPSIANVVVSLVCTLVSYVAQKQYTFK